VFRRHVVTLSATLLILAPLVAVVGASAPASADVIMGSNWPGGPGVPVCFPTYASCSGVTTTTTGNGFQCVDLAQRFWDHFGWNPSGGTLFRDVPGCAGEIWTGFANDFPNQIVKHPNGTGYIPVHGDLIVSYCHVAVVDYVSGGTVYVQEENNPEAGPYGSIAHSYAINGKGTLTRSEVQQPIYGVVHAKADTFGPNTSAVSAVVNGGSEDAYFRGNDNGLFEVSYSNGGWHGPAEIPGTAGGLSSAPSAVVNGGSEDAYFRGNDNGLFEVSYSNGGWHGPAEIPGTAGGLNIG
jgi:hypothetical protein